MFRNLTTMLNVYSVIFPSQHWGFTYSHTQACGTVATYVPDYQAVLFLINLTCLSERL